MQEILEQVPPGRNSTMKVVNTRMMTILDIARQMKLKTIVKMNWISILILDMVNRLGLAIRDLLLVIFVDLVILVI